MIFSIRTSVHKGFEDPVPVMDRMQVVRGDDIGGGPWTVELLNLGLEMADCQAHNRQAWRTLLGKAMSDGKPHHGEKYILCIM